MSSSKSPILKILIVDDEPDFLFILKRALSSDNYLVTTALNEKECMEAIQRDKPDLLLLDVMLGESNGVDICKAIKNNPEFCSIYIILISALKIDTENISEGLETGADGYLAKPIKNRELIARVEAAFRIIKAEKAMRESEARLKQFTIHLLNIHEEEKILLATQLDNELGQILVALKMEIGMIKKKVMSENISAATEDLVLKLDRAYNVVGNSINTSVKFMNQLRNEVLYLIGFVDAVKLYTSDFQEKYNIVCEIDTDFQKLEIDKNTETSLFHIFQKAMSNVALHAKATNVRINLHKSEEKLILEIWDNGIGFDPNLPLNSESTGLIYMKERALLLNGELHVESSENRGSSVRVEIPYTNT